MARTDALRQQHNEMLAIATRIASLLKPDELSVEQTANAVRSDLSALAGKLMIHLAVEDKNLYPALSTSPDITAQGMAKKFQEEMGGLAQAFKDYTSSFPTGKAISSDPNSFITRTNAVFTALKQRIEREERDLYPLADKA
jgi:hemerythrin-like domain-containing protein